LTLKLAKCYYQDMFKKLLLLFFVISFIPVFAGEVEDAIAKKENIFVYLYTPTCGSCKSFDPIFKMLEQNNSDICKFLKINANTQYGYYIMQSYNARYVPFVIIVNGKAGKAAQMANVCIHDYNCAESTIKNFLN